MPERLIPDVPSQPYPNSFLSFPPLHDPAHPLGRVELQSHDTLCDGVILFDVESGKMELHSEGG